MSKPRWYAIYTNVSCEKRAALSVMDALRDRDPDGELGLAVYLPVETRWARHARKKEAVTRPLFVRYLFAYLREDDMHIVRACDGVEDFVRSCGQPVFASAADVNRFRDAEAAGAFDTTRPKDTFDGPFKDGDTVKVAVGAYADWPGTVLRMTAENRALVLLSMFGRDHEREIRTDHLKAA